MRSPAVAELMRLALACASFNEDAFRDGIELAVVGEREVLATTAFFLTHEHHGSILHLFQVGHEGSALAMLRPCFESMARGIWLLRASNDDQLRRFCEGIDAKAADGLVRDLRKGQRASEDAFLLDTWTKSKSSLNQFTHTSYQLLARRVPDEDLQRARDPGEIGEAVRFVTGTAMLATIELAQMATLPDIERRARNLLAALYPPKEGGGP